MIKIIECIYKWTARVYDKLFVGKAGRSVGSLILIILLIFFEKVEDETGKTIVAGIFIFCLLLFTLVAQFVFISDKRGDFNLKHYLIYCSGCSVILFTFLFMLFGWLKVNIFSFSDLGSLHIILYFSLSFSVFSIFWFTAILVFKFKSIEWVKAKVSKITAIVTSLNIVIAIIDKNILVYSVVIILGSYVWMNYLIDEYALQRSENE